MLPRSVTLRPRRPRPPTARRRGVAAALLAALQALSGPAPAAERADLEAAIVFNLLAYVEWPADAAPAPGGSLTLCVNPASRLAPPLHSLVGRAVRGQRLEVTDLPAPEGLRRCHAAYLDSGLGDGQGPAWRRQGPGVPVLLIGDERPGAPGDIVAVHLVQADGRVAFEVDMAPVRAARLQINSRLLRLARRVGE